MIKFTKEVKVSDKVSFGGNKRFSLIGGPCVIESEELVMEVAGILYYKMTKKMK